jgi:hypothetical protein
LRLLALGLIDLEHHPLRVDVPDLEIEPLGDSQPSRIECQDYGPVFDIGDTCDDPSYLVSRENDRQRLRSLAVRDMSYYPIAFARDGVEELQCTDGLVELTPRGVQFVDDPKLKVSNLFGPKFFWVFPIPHREPIDVIRVSVDRTGREVP